MLIELQILNLIISKGDVHIIIDNDLTSKYFPHYKAEFNFIFNHYKNYNQVPDIETFIKTFPNFEVLEVNESLEYLINELHNESNKNFLAETFNNVRDLLMKGNTDEAMSVLSKASDKASSSKNLTAIDILEDTSRYEEYIDKCNDFQKYYISTGLKELDKIIGGWDRKSELAVWSARSGQGKSWLLLKGAEAAVKRGLRVGLFSGEMEANKVGYRFDTLMSHLSNGKIVHGNIDVSIEYKKYLNDLKANHKGHLFILTPDRVDGDVTVNVLRSFIEKYNIDILFVDQHSLIVDKSHARTSFEKAANISKDLKHLQTIKQIPIISAVQQNRSSIEEGKFAGTENIAQSDRIAQDATTILFISSKDGIMTISIGKARDGGTNKTLNYEVDLNHGKFTYLPDEEDINNTSEETEFSPMNYSSYELEGAELPFE